MICRFLLLACAPAAMASPASAAAGAVVEVTLPEAAVGLAAALEACAERLAKIQSEIAASEAASAATSDTSAGTMQEAAAGLAVGEESHARWARLQHEIAEHEAVITALKRKYRGRRGRFSLTDQLAWNTADAKLKFLLPRRGFTELHFACEAHDEAGVRVLLRRDSVDAFAHSLLRHTPLAVARSTNFPTDMRAANRETEVARLMQEATGPWSPQASCVWPTSFRRGVLVMLWVGQRVALPKDVLLNILGICSRHWFRA